MKNKKAFFVGVLTVALFVLWTALVTVVDVRAIGPNGSSVGFSSLNGWFHSLTGANMWLYEITDWLGLVPIAVAFAFAVLGLCQWIARKSIKRVDKSLFVLGGFYVAVIITYAVFEYVVINYRPILINGVLEASYPSSTTMLVTTVMPTAIHQLAMRIKNQAVCRVLSVTFATFTVFMGVGRVLSGVHWLSDIVGGLLISAGLVLIYYSLTYTEKKSA